MRSKALESLAVATSMFSTWFTIGIFAPYLPLYAYYTLGASNFIVGLLSTIYFSANAPSSLATGYIADKYNHIRELMVFALAAMSIGSLLTAYVNSAELLLLIRLLQGFSTATIVPLSNLLSSELFGPGKGVGFINMIGSVGFLTASLLGGILLEYISYRDLFIVSAFIPLIPLIIILFLSKITFFAKETYQIRLSCIRELNKSVIIMYVSVFFRQLGAAGVWSLFSLFIYSLGGDNVIIGLAFMLNTLTQILLFEKIGKFSEGRGKPVFEIGLLLSSIVFMGYYVAPNAVFILPFQVVLGIAWTTLYSGINVFIIENTPSEIRATSLGLINTMLALGWIFGSLLAGIVADIYGSYHTYILVALCLSLLGFLISNLYGKLRLS